MKNLLCLLASCWLLAAPARAAAQHGPAAVQVFPSPAHGELTVQLPEATPRAGWQLELLNVLGRVVWQQALPAATPATVPTARMPAGLYWVRLRGPQGYEAVQRVVLS